MTGWRRTRDCRVGQWPGTEGDPGHGVITQRAPARRVVGDVLDGTVVSAVPFGSVVEVAEGVHGLVHESETDEPLAPGTPVRVEVLDVDVDGSRLSLRPV